MVRRNGRNSEYVLSTLASVAGFVLTVAAERGCITWAEAKFTVTEIADVVKQFVDDECRRRISELITLIANTGEEDWSRLRKLVELLDNIAYWNVCR